MAEGKQVKVSVIVPVHNTEQYLGKCLDSLVNQTLEEIQIICVNDGSTDRSGEILKEYAQKDERIYVIEQENQGQAAARNAALEIAEGEYCTFVDSDDWMDVNAFENLYIKAVHDQLDVLYFAGTTEFDTKSVAEHHEKYFDRAYQRDKIDRNIVDGRQMLKQQIEAGQYWRVAYLCLIRSVFLNGAGIRFRDGIRYEDNLFAYMLCLRAQRTASIPDHYYHRLLRENSTITSNRTSADLYGYVTTIIDEISLLEGFSGHHEEKEAFCTVIDDTLKRAYNVWKSLNEQEREQIDRYFRGQACDIREKDLYHSLFLSWFREEEERLRLLEKNEELRQRLRKAKSDQEQLRQEKQAIFNTSSYRLGHTLLTPARKISELLKGKKGHK